MLAIVAGRVVEIEKGSGGEADFRRNIRGAVRGLWSGALDIFGFLESMNATINRGFNMAWNEGAASVGLTPDERTDEERNALYTAINGDLSQTIALANAIIKGQKQYGGKLTPLLRRAEMWTLRYGAIVSQAMAMAGRDKKLKWVWSPEKEHCESCQVLNGRVYRASVWARYNLRPRSRDLQCRGYRCGCRFETTTDPVTPGRPPAV